MTGKLGFYLWLIEALRNRQMTLTEIKEKWSRSSHNVDQTELTDRTFHRYRENIVIELGVHIECSKKAGNVYYIRESVYDDRNTLDWLLSAFRISAMAQRMKQHDKIMLESPPQDTLLLDDILNAIDDKKCIRFDYESAYGVRSNYTMVPDFVRLFRQRWYVIGRIEPTNGVKILAVNRMSGFEILAKPSSRTKPLVPEEFFRDCYGIIRQPHCKAEKIRLRAFWPQYVFLEETPLHASQTLVADSGDGEYREYEVRVQPTFDFKQELLKNGRGLVVVSPEWFRQETIATLQDMVSGYVSGEDFSGEGKGHDASET